MLIRAFQRFREKAIYEDRIMRKVRSFVDHRVHAFDCAACGGAQVVVGSDARVGLCHAFLGSGRTFVGSIYDENFVPEQHSLWREWSLRSPLNMPECTGCRCLGICGGGCPANDPDDNIWRISEAFCAHSRTILDWLIWDLFEQTLRTQSEPRQETYQQAGAARRSAAESLHGPACGILTTAP